MTVDTRAVDWPRLTAAAVDALQHAYVPYSGFPVGAAALTEDGRLVSGCNIENASYGLTLCAECSLLSELMMGGGGRLAAFVCVNADHDVIMPCGRCRQLLSEHRGTQMVLMTPAGVLGMDEVLPQSFGPADLEAAAH